MPLTVLITGANGFIGSHTTLLLESAGLRVVPVDIKGRSHDLSLLPIQTATLQLDVTDTTSFREICERAKVTHIFHAAWPPREETPEVINFCLQAMRNIFEAARQIGIERVVFASSGAVYGRLRKKDAGAIQEDDPVPIHPTFLYRSAKLLGEWIGGFYAEQCGVGFVALRFSSVYGPGLARGIPLAVKEGILGRPCRLYLTRLPDDPVYVEDAAEAVRLACFSEGPLGPAYNIGAGRAYWHEDLERAVRKHLPEARFEIGKHPDVMTVGRHRDRDVLDITLAKQDLGFTPRFELDKGIAATAEWVRSNLQRLS